MDKWDPSIKKFVSIGGELIKFKSNFFPLEMQQK